MCDCISKVQKSLVEHNTQVDVCLGLTDNTFKFLGVYLRTHKIDKKKRGQPKSIVASHCPFCGERYESAP